MRRGKGSGTFVPLPSTWMLEQACQQAAALVIHIDCGADRCLRSQVKVADADEVRDAAVRPGVGAAECMQDVRGVEVNAGVRRGCSADGRALFGRRAIATQQAVK